MDKKVALLLGFMLGLTFFILFGDHISTYSPYLLNKDAILLPPSWGHLFGTDRLGRDIFARVIEGGRVSMLIGIGSAVIGTFIGLIVGISAGFFKGVVDRSIVIAIDLFLTFPTFFLLLTLVSYVNASAVVLIVVISVTGWMGTARMIRSESFGIGDRPFIKILKLAGVSKTKILLKYYAPLIAPIFLISFTFGVSGAILAESALSFLGLGVMPPQMSWGSMLSDGKEVMDIAWWVSFFPGLFIFIVSYLLIQLSDYLQKEFNKKENTL